MNIQGNSRRQRGTATAAKRELPIPVSFITLLPAPSTISEVFHRNIFRYMFVATFPNDWSSVNWCIFSTCASPCGSVTTAVLRQLNGSIEASLMGRCNFILNLIILVRWSLSCHIRSTRKQLYRTDLPIMRLCHQAPHQARQGMSSEQ
jgi:hypothetical protein